MSAAANRPEPELIAFPDTPERRLRRALAALDVALAEQRSAIAEFRSQLGDLQGSVVQLDGSARALRGALAGAAEDAARAQATARELVANADRFERVARG
jgi:uncharacterized coiled-coil protein SlyX